MQAAPVRVLVAEPGRHEGVHRARRQRRGRGGRGRLRRRLRGRVGLRGRLGRRVCGRIRLLDRIGGVRRRRCCRRFGRRIRRGRGGLLGGRRRVRRSGRLRRWIGICRRIGRGNEARHGEQRQPRAEQADQHQSSEGAGSGGRRYRGITHHMPQRRPAGPGEASNERTNLVPTGHARTTRSSAALGLAIVLNRPGVAPRP